MGKKKLSALKCRLSHLTCGSLVALSKARPGVDRGGSNGKRKIPWRTRDKGERGGHPADGVGRGSSSVVGDAVSSRERCGRNARAHACPSEDGPAGGRGQRCGNEGSLRRVMGS